MSDDTFGPGMGAADWLGDFAKALGDPGNASMQSMQTQLAQRSEKDRAMAAKVLRVFSTKDGAEVLDWLVANTLRRGEVPVDLIMQVTPHQLMAHALFRAGENSVTELIMRAMAQAQQKRSKRRKA